MTESEIDSANAVLASFGELIKEGTAVYDKVRQSFRSFIHCASICRDRNT